jgi:predicted nucleic acid-binding protein
MATRVSAFLDTSALFAGIWSAEGGARMLLKLGETGAIRLLVSSHVLDEIERVLRRKAPDTLGQLAMILDRASVEVAPPPPAAVIRESQALISHPGDAQVLAAAWTARVDYLVTLDRQHFLNNLALRKALPFPVGTPGDFLAWYRRQFP